MPNTRIRFDSLDRRSGNRSIRFDGLIEEIEARSLEEVRPALAELERATRAGAHAAGFVCYEAAPAMDPALVTHPPEPERPLLWFGLFADRREGVALEGLDPGEAHAPEGRSKPAYSLGTLQPALTRAQYAQRVARILELIAAGDTYQVNLTFPLWAPFAGSEVALYRDLCLSQRSGFCALIQMEGRSILSASPELFFRREGERIELRPMKGTRPRGRWAAEDEELAGALAASAKDRAENLMIVDLLRNDLGRVARFGSVSVTRLFEVERYPTVLQMTSSVEGRVDPSKGLDEIFQALFPCGSITGAPKVRTSEIIREVEQGPRGIYTGAIGIASPGAASFNVAIRTAVIDHRAGTLTLGVGSGITADSAAAAEYAECLRKGAFVEHRQPPFELLETMRFEGAAGCELLDGHLARLSASAEYFDYPLDLPALRRQLDALGGSLADGVHKVRLLLASSGQVRLESEPIPPELPPARIAIASAPVDETDPFLFHKTTHRERYRRALAEHPGADDVILWNRGGELTEACNANLVLEIDGALVTPPLEAGLLPGVMRAKLLAEGRIAERVLRLDELRGASAIYLINAVRRWRQATVLGERE